MCTAYGVCACAYSIRDSAEHVEMRILLRRREIRDERITPRESRRRRSGAVECAADA